MKRRMLGILRQYTLHWNTAAMKEQWKKANTGLQHQQNPPPIGFTIYQLYMTCGMPSTRSDVWLCLENPELTYPSFADL